MAITTVEAESIHGAVGQQRMIWYKAQDDTGEWHSFGPIITSDDNFDIEGYKTRVANDVAESLADAEFENIVGGGE